MNNKEKLLEQLKIDDKYQQVLAAVDEDVRAHIEKFMEAFMDQTGSDLDVLQRSLEDPAIAAQLKETWGKKDK